jgi:hypothetical protein
MGFIATDVKASNITYTYLYSEFSKYDKLPGSIKWVKYLGHLNTFQLKFLVLGIKALGVIRKCRTTEDMYVY